MGLHWCTILLKMRKQNSTYINPSINSSELLSLTWTEFCGYSWSGSNLQFWHSSGSSVVAGRFQRLADPGGHFGCHGAWWQCQRSDWRSHVAAWMEFLPLTNASFLPNSQQRECDWQCDETILLCSSWDYHVDCQNYIGSILKKWFLFYSFFLNYFWEMLSVIILCCLCGQSSHIFNEISK